MITSPIEAQNSVGPAMVESAGLGKKYALKGAGDEFWALRGVSFVVPEGGTVLGIIGRNGAGKTTLLNIIAGTLSATEGKMNARGRILPLFNLGVGFQDELSGRENVFLNGAILGATKRELDTKFSAIAEFSELGEFIDMPLGSYSQGMRLRLAFSIVANLDFDILLIDEVLAVGDALFQNKCFERLADFKRAGKALIITTQSMELIERLCDNVILLDHGSIVCSGRPDEVVNRYRSLLNSEKFFVGPAANSAALVENTKKWADDISEWGNELGTKEVIIKSVKFINRFGFACAKARSGRRLRVKVDFIARNDIKEPHFGVAAFRSDGVYCYGPNTLFDGHRIPRIKKGSGYFILEYRRLLLAPGEYTFSIAIWDKNEALAYSYHNGCHKLPVDGYDNEHNELLNIPLYHDIFSGKDKLKPAPVALNESKLNGIALFNGRGEKKSVFMTNEKVKVKVNFKEPPGRGMNNYLWLGIYRDDGVYCYGITKRMKVSDSAEVTFPKLPLLPGGYNLSVGVWDASENKFITHCPASHPFRMVFNRQDHGTVYMEHKWQWRWPE